MSFNPEGMPIVYLHGGPGSRCTPASRRNFDLQRHRAVLFDQRAAGRSRPYAGEMGVHGSSLDMDHHVRDIEQLCEHLGIERWIVFGSRGIRYWERRTPGDTCRHPGRVTAVVLAAVSTGMAYDIDWLTVHVGRFFPGQWREFRDHIPPERREQRLVEAYNDLLMDPIRR